MKILITGANGGIGSALQKTLASHELSAHGSDTLDVLNDEAVKSFFSDFQPDVLINCAAFTAVDLAESQKDQAFALNAHIPKFLAELCNQYGTYLVHYSTDYVFDGKKPVPNAYVESDLTNPMSMYGQSKREGEIAIAQIFDNYAILRTSWIYSQHQPCFLRSIYRKWQENPHERLKIVDDQHGSPTSNHNIAQQTLKVIENRIQGIYHASSHGHTTWYELAQYFFQQLRHEVDIQACSSSQYPTPAQRPVNSILHNKALITAGLDCMMDWQEDLQNFLSTNTEKLFI
jgi:dTDP-4-dehydrorhamnose reductase